MPTSKPTCGTPSCNSVQETSDDLPQLGDVIAAVLAAIARDPRVRTAVRELGAEFFSAAPKKSTDLTTSEVADALAVSTATIRRAGIEPTRFVGNAARWDLDDARAKLDARGRKPTTPTKKPASETDVDITDVIARGGLRVVGGGK